MVGWLGAKESGITTCTPLSGSRFPVGETTVTCTVNDGTTTDTCTFAVIVDPAQTAPAVGARGLFAVAAGLLGLGLWAARPKVR
jgi:hypothetical protein